jgi:molybdopterin molybdotransferase
MTGAPVPVGADAIVPVEDAAVDGATVRLPAAATGAYVREAGSDVAAGDVVVAGGIRLASRHLAALAAAGLTAVPVHTRPRLAIVSTGSELAEPGSALAFGQIPDANGVALDAASRASGATVVHRGRVADEPDRLAAELDAALTAGAELVLTSGGVSMGEHEVVRELLEPLGAHVDVLAMQPGGPQATAAWRGVPVVCFPGNPVSSQLSFELFVAPVLRELAGLPPAVVGAAPLATALTSPAGKRQYLRGRRRDDGSVETVSGAGSHLVAGLAAAEVLMIIPEDVTALAAGETVEVHEL